MTPVPDITVWLDSGRDLESFFEERARQDRNPAEIVLLHRCALLRSFDRALLAGPLSEELPPGASVDLDAFLRGPEIVPAAGVENEYYLKENARAAHLEWWAAGRHEALQGFCERMLAHFKQSGATIDAFGMRAIARPEEARKEFIRRYHDADRAPDLAACESLLNMLRWYGDLLPPQLGDALKDRERYFSGRVMFADDWSRTARFLARNAITGRFDKFMRLRRKWIFHIYAKGGAGKTAYLRWLTARHCVVEKGEPPHRLPVAKLDMDFVRLASLDAAPWLILLPIADQLDRQIPGRPFRSAMPTWLQQAPLLDRLATQTSTQRVDEAQTKALIADFTAALGTRPVLVILDTLEEIVLRHGQSLATVLDIFSQVNSSCRGFRLVLSGRYDLRKRDELASSIERFFGQMVPISLATFSKTEALKYLRKVRRLIGKFDLEAIVEKSGLNPFKLALYADLAKQRGSMSRQDIEDLGDVEREYLIQRIIERIPDSEMPLRWLLRYAVIARPGRLDEEFLKRVLRRHLEREMSKEGLELLLDKPDISVWRPDAGQFTLDQIWKRLLDYRSESGWIDVVKGSPVLQSEVVIPMRAILQKEEIFCAIHNDAAGYFEGKGIMEEALYHRFWSEGPAAATYWETYLAAAPTLDAAEALASLLYGGDLLDDDQNPLPHENFGVVIELKTVAEAAFELASLCVRKYLRDLGPSSLLTRAQDYLTGVSRLEGKVGGPVIGAARRALVQAALLARKGQIADALSIVNGVLADSLGSSDRIMLNVLKARLIQDQDSAAAIQCLDAAAELSLENPHLAFSLSWIRARQGRLQFERDRLDLAGECYRESLAGLEREQSPATEIVTTLETLAQLSRSCLKYSEVPGWIAHAERLPARVPAARYFARHNKARLFLDRGDLHNANIAADYGYQGELPGCVARQQELTAEVLWAMHEYKEATQLFDKAQRSYGTDKNEDGMLSMSLRRGRMTVEGIGDLKAAPETRITSNQWTISQRAILQELHLLRLVKGGRREEARTEWSGRTFPGARVSARYLALGLALELTDADTGFNALLDAFTLVHPRQARLPVLDPFRHFSGKPLHIQGETARRFFELFPSLEKDDPDFCFQAVAFADMLRYGGGNEAAAHFVKEALEKAPSECIGLRRKLILAAQRVDLVLADAILLDYLRAADEQGDAFKTVARIEQAEWWWKRGQTSHVQDALSGCKPESVAETQFAMRYYTLYAALDTQDSVKMLAQARQIATELGWPPPPDLPKAKMTPESMAPPLASLYPSRQTLTIRPEPETGLPAALVVSLETEDAKPAVGRLDLNKDPLLRDILRQGGRARAADYFSDLEPALNRLRLLMPDPLRELLPQTSSAAVDVAIVTADGPLAGLPWEAAAERGNIRFLFRQPSRGENTGDSVVWLQAWLANNGFPVTVDGIAGPQTLEMLAKAQKALGIQAAWVSVDAKQKMLKAVQRNETSIFLMQPSHEAQRFNERGYGAMSLALEREYAEHGHRAEQMIVGTPSPQPQPRLIHATFDFVDTRQGVALNTSASSPQEPMNPARLGTILDPGRNAVKSFVILDPPHPGNPREWARQLVLRNQFAQELLATRRVWGVLATGLVGPDRDALRQHLVTLVSDVSSRRCAGDVAKACDRFSALFCWDPTLPVW